MKNKAVRPTCTSSTDTRQVDSQIDRVEAALTEKSRICRVFKMKLGAEMTDAALAEQMDSSREMVQRWRNANDRTAPTLVALLLADDQVFDVLVRELCEARVRLGHGRRTLIDGDAAERSERLVAALSRAQTANDELAAAVSDVRRTR